jgi:hypothetical protein
VMREEVEEFLAHHLAARAAPRTPPTRNLSTC